jgi:hypothetical protein
MGGGVWGFWLGFMALGGWYVGAMIRAYGVWHDGGGVWGFWLGFMVYGLRRQDVGPMIMVYSLMGRDAGIVIILNMKLLQSEWVFFF